MRTDVARDLSASSFDFQRAVWPTIRLWFGGGELVSVESVSSSGFTKDMDILAGIDAWHIQREKSLMRGIATRVQWVDGERGFETFTIRYARRNGEATEYKKRLRALNDTEHGYLYPHLTVQAYLTKPQREGRLISVAAVETARLFGAVAAIAGKAANGEYSEDWGMRSAENAQFLWMRWRYLQSVHIRLKTWGATRLPVTLAA